MGGGGGGGQQQPTQTNVTNTNIPEYARPYVETMLGATQQQLFNTAPNAQGGLDITSVKPYTPFGAEGFPAVDGEELQLADTPELFAKAVVSLLRDPLRRAELGRKARRFVQRGYGWQVLLPRLEQEYCRESRSGPVSP